MEYSAEVRWFFPNALPEPLQVWFAAGQELPSGQRRDQYLILPGCETVGVKRRGGSEQTEARFEVKALIGAAEAVRYAGEVTGRSDRWVKWSYGADPVQGWLQALQQESEGWVDVEKRRWMRRFRVEGDAIAEVKEEQEPGGCAVEITDLIAQGQPWWSLAFEASVSPMPTRELLHRVAEAFFAAQPCPVPLRATHSCAYPVWLNTLPRPDGDREA